VKQSVALVVDNAVVERCMPMATEELLPGVFWGTPWTLFTPAYWLSQAWMAQLGSASPSHYSARDGAVGELVFCLLGGHGITAELSTAAYERCRDAGLIAHKEIRADAWQSVLSGQMQLADRVVRYRYPNQKAKFLAAAMSAVRQKPLRLDCGLTLRSQLLEMKGVGYKTASWVVRNVLDSDEVAILDVHIIRAGRLCGLFSDSDRVERDYLSMEDRFLRFSKALGLRPAALDCLIWDQMRDAGELPVRILAGKMQSTAAKSPTQTRMAF
jgi:N-glycosylase/DNA lyase